MLARRSPPFSDTFLYRVELPNMITDLWIENFKGIGKRQHIPLRPITLLFGRNSAGKSTVLHALQYLREILRNHNFDPKLPLDREANVIQQAVLPVASSAEPRQTKCISGRNAQGTNLQSNQTRSEN